MRKVIEGRTYNTETATKLGVWWAGYGRNDFKFCQETLYRNSRGAYFLHGEGGAMSKYSSAYGDSRGYGETILPMTEEEAREWAERQLDAEDYEKAFGLPEEAEGDLVNRERVNLTLGNETIALLRKLSAESGVPMARMVDKAVLKMYKAE